jgi:hypothetical protein
MASLTRPRPHPQRLRQPSPPALGSGNRQARPDSPGCGIHLQAMSQWRHVPAIQCVFETRLTINTWYNGPARVAELRRKAQSLGSFEAFTGRDGRTRPRITLALAHAYAGPTPSGRPTIPSDLTGWDWTRLLERVDLEPSYSQGELRGGRFLSRTCETCMVMMLHELSRRWSAQSQNPSYHSSACEGSASASKWNLDA